MEAQGGSYEEKRAPKTYRSQYHRLSYPVFIPLPYRGTSPQKKTPTPPGPQAQAYGRVLGVCIFLQVRYPCIHALAAGNDADAGPASARHTLIPKPVRGTSLTRKRTLLGPYILGICLGSWRVERFLVGDVPL